MKSYPSFHDVVVQALGDFLRCSLNPEMTVIRGYTGRVSKPPCRDYVLITPMNIQRLAGNVLRYDDSAPHTVVAGSQTVIMPARRRVQLDFYGSCAGEWAEVCAVLLGGETGCTALATYGLTPLWVEAPQCLDGADGSADWSGRWMVGVLLQANASHAVPLDFFDNVNLRLRPQA